MAQIVIGHNVILVGREGLADQDDKRENLSRLTVTRLKVELTQSTT